MTVDIGASKQADDDENRRAILDEKKISQLRKLLGLNVKKISRAKDAPPKQKYYKKSELIDMIMADSSITVTNK